ncbi:MAG: hypothetical protein HC840_13195 [Leptolyngbyaceae cyanobacterium RM2_2_4]|nr:hypothetical protein [Leptolyngbyaceae cyanobacterium RM2_2_4]
MASGAERLGRRFIDNSSTFFCGLADSASRWHCVNFDVNFLLTPAIAQKDIPASVVLDGREIFQISSSGEYTAQERAELVNSLLQEAVQERQPIQIEVEQRNGLPTVLLNDRHLVTVTERDAPPGSTADEQARVWVRRLRTAVQQAQQQRTVEFLQWAGVIALGVVAIACLLHWGLGQFWQRSLRPSLAAILPRPEADEDTEHPQALNILLGLLLALSRLIKDGVIPEVPIFIAKAMEIFSSVPEQSHCGQDVGLPRVVSSDDNGSFFRRSIMAGSSPILRKLPMPILARRISVALVTPPPPEPPTARNPARPPHKPAAAAFHRSGHAGPRGSV